MSHECALRLLFWLPVGFSCAVAGLCETEAIAICCGCGGAREFWTVTVAELATVIMLPSSAFLHKTGRAKKCIERRGKPATHFLAAARILMTGIPLVANTLLYYAFMNVSFGYMAIISLIFMAMAYPGKDKSAE